MSADSVMFCFPTDVVCIDSIIFLIITKTTECGAVDMQKKVDIRSAFCSLNGSTKETKGVC